jgi:hypothetical protein
VPEFDVAAGDQVLIQCPACGATEAADAAVLADSPTIVCRKCGETWPTLPRRRKRRIAAGGNEGAASPVVDAERRPLVTFSGRPGQAWAAKMEGDVVTAPIRSPRAPLIAGGIASAVFLAAFFTGREAAVGLVPDLAGLYAWVGLPVNLDGLVIEGMAAERSSMGENARLTVRGAIRNISAGDQPVPALTLSFRDSAGAPAGWRDFDPPARSIASGRAEPFLLAIDDAPRQAADILIRFRRPAEEMPDKGQGSISAP